MGQRKTRRKAIPLEQQFLHLWVQHAADEPIPIRGHQFDEMAGRKWKFDFAWVSERVAVEIEGGAFHGQGRHVRGTGYHRDCDKYNSGQLQGWIVLRFTALHLRDEQAEMLAVILASLKSRRRMILDCREVM